MSHVAVLGGGLAGLASAAALSGAGYRVTVLESRPFLGGRATSYPSPSGVTIDNCQHILLRCCVNLMDFYRRLGVQEQIEFHREFYFLEPGGRMSVMKAGALPAPLHFSGAFAGLRFLSWTDKLAIGRALLAVKSEYRTRTDLDRLTMQDWLREKRQPARATERFWRQILVSAINEELDRMAARHGLQVFWLGFLAASDSYQMGIPRVPLGELYAGERWRAMPGVELRLRAPASNVVMDNGRVASVDGLTADHYIAALPADRLALLGLPLDIEWDAFEGVPITGIHLWFDRSVTRLPHGTLLDRTIQWFYNKGEGRYLQLVVSASRSLLPMGRQEIIDLAVRELGEFLPEVRDAKVVDAHVVKEVRATFSARPGLERHRAEPRTPISNLSLAGDWTNSGWPATMEGAVRSGYRAAEAACAALGQPQTFLLPDIA